MTTQRVSDQFASMSFRIISTTWTGRLTLCVALFIISCPTVVVPTSSSITSVDNNDNSLRYTRFLENSGIVSTLEGLMKIGLDQVAEIIGKGGENYVEEKPNSTIPVGDTNSYKNVQARTDYFQIKMFWKNGYKWNGSSNEREYCMECKGSCGSNDQLIVKNCDKDNKYQRWVIINNKIRPHRRLDYCLNSDKEYPITFKKCTGDKDEYQEWDVNIFGQKFEFQQTLNGKKYCISTRDDPKNRKKVRLVRCKNAVKGDTSYWVTGRFDY